MRELFTDLYKKVAGFFQPADEKENVKDVACNRLKFVLMQDRTNLNPQLLERMRGEMIDLLSKYVEMDKEALELSFEQEGESLALMLSIPVIRAKDEEEIQAIIEAEEKAKLEKEQSEDSQDSEETESENPDEVESEATEETEICACGCEDNEEHTCGEECDCDGNCGCQEDEKECDCDDCKCDSESEKIEETEEKPATSKKSKKK